MFTRNLRNYLVGLVALLICAGVYHEVSVRLLAVPDIDPISPRPPTQTVLVSGGLEDLFPAGSWQLGNCKRVLTSSGTLLFKTWQQNADGSWELEELTLVIGRGIAASPAESPIVIHAPEGAVIELAEPLDLVEGGTPVIKIARMKGDVTIHRANPQKKTDELSFRTSNLRFDNQKVWTTQNITMQIAGANLRGKDLTLYLASSAASATKAETPATLLDRMELVYLQELTIPLDKDVPTNTVPRRLGSVGDDDIESKGVVKIASRNGLGYDFAIDQLTVRDSVRMVREVHGRTVDSFLCDTLQLVLRDPANESIQRDGPLDWLDRVNAIGTPARLNLSAYDFELKAEQIDFDAQRGLLKADGNGGIILKRDFIEAQLANLAYRFDPAMPEQIGMIDVAGAGQIVIRDTELMLRKFRWSQGLKVEPIGQATVDAIKEKNVQASLGIRINGDVFATLSDGGTARAGAIEGMLVPYYYEVTEESVALTEGTTVNQPELKRVRQMTLIPKQFSAFDSVSIDSSQVVANTNRLHLFFETSADFVQRFVQPAPKPEDQLALDQKVYQPGDGLMLPGAAQPRASLVSRTKRKSDFHPPVARPRPVVSGDTFSAKILMTAEEFQPQDISVQDNVAIENTVNVGEQLMVLKLFGKSLRVERNDVEQASGKDYFVLSGDELGPARLVLGDGVFVGSQIQVWPTRSLIKVDGAGEAIVPSALLANTQENPNQNVDSPATKSKMPKVKWISPPHCRWGEGMLFDGSKALLKGGVQIDAQLVSGSDPWITTMNGEELQISLARPIDLSDDQSFSKAELAEITLTQGGQRPVMVRAEQLGLDQVTQAVHMIRAQSLVFSPAAGGRVVGGGPGWYRGWVVMEQKRSILAPSEQQPQSPSRRVLQGVHLTFREALHGDLQNEVLAFTGGVQVGARELTSWEDSVDIAEMERLAIGEMTMSCTQLRFGITPGVPEDIRSIPGLPTPWDMVAEGGVVMRANTETRGLIEGSAQRASYESRKSWLTIEGAPGRSATIRQTWPGGKPGGRADFPRVMVNLKTYDFQAIMKDAQINSGNLPRRPQ